MAWMRAASFAALFLWAFPAPGLAQDVTLTSRDGDVEISGDLLGFDGEFYRVETVYGELTVDGSGVICKGPGCPDLEAYVARLTFSGAPSVGRVLLPALAEAFAVRNGWRTEREAVSARETRYAITDPDSDRTLGEFTFRRTDTEEGLADLLANEADVAMALREVRPAEVERGKAAGLGDLTAKAGSRVIALDALVPVVAPSNPVRSVSLTELGAILSGELDSWAELGGPDAPISVHVHGPRTGLGQATEDKLLAPAGVALAETAAGHPGGPDLDRAVAADPFAIGVTSRSAVDEAEELAVERRLRLLGFGHAPRCQDRGLPAHHAGLPLPAVTAPAPARARFPVLSAHAGGPACHPPRRLRRSGAGGNPGAPAGQPVCQRHLAGRCGHNAGRVAADGGVPRPARQADDHLPLRGRLGPAGRAIAVQRGTTGPRDGTRAV